MSTEGTDSGYGSHALSCDTSTSSLNESWAVVTRNGRPCQAKLTGQCCCKEFVLDDEEVVVEEDDITLSLGRQRTHTSNLSGTVCAGQLGTGNNTADPLWPRDGWASDYKSPSTLLHEFHDARSQLQLAMQRDMDSRKHSLASIQHLSNASLHLAQHPSTDRSTLNGLDKQCREDATELLERHNDVLRAWDMFNPILKKLAECEDRIHMRHACTQGVSSPSAAYEGDGLSEVSEGSSKAPSVLERYFNLAGEEFVADERLNELEAEHRETLAKCQGKLDEGGEHLPESSSKHEELYSVKRRELIDARRLARRQLQVQRDICLSQGINPERYRYRRSFAADRKRFSGRDFLQDLQEKGRAKHIHESVIGWLDQDIGN